jgi:DNA-binding transcriptional MocR family regulator
LVEDHQVSPVTVSRALAALAAEGLVVTRPGAGTFVADPAPASDPVDYGWQTIALADRTIDAGGISVMLDRGDDDHSIPLSVGYLHSSLMPLRQLAAAASRSARLPGAWEPPPPSGLSGLRTWFARQAGPGIGARDVTVTPGGQASISAVLRALVPAGDTLLVESPTYPGAVAVARAAGMRTVPVPIDGDGVVPGLLAEALERTRAKAVLLQPTYGNPTGAVLAPDRRGEVLRAAAEAGAFVIEDDFARWLGHDDRVPPPLIADDTDGRVISICSLTKVTSPSLRIGAIVARGPVIERIRALRIVDDLFVPRPTQETALEIVSRAGWQRHLDQLHVELARRCAAFVAGVARRLPAATLTARPRGGLHLWLRLPPGLDDVAAARAAREGGVTVMPGRLFFPAEPPAAHLRLTFSAAPGTAELDTGLRRLAAAVPELASD